MAAVRGEYIGPGCGRGNYYDLKAPELRVFDIKVGTRYLPVQQVTGRVLTSERVPVLAEGVTLREWLDSRSLPEASNGMSVLNPNRLREGIVIKPMVEGLVDFGVGDPNRRLILKPRSPKYLAKHG